MIEIQKDAIDLAIRVAEYFPCRDFLHYVQTQSFDPFLSLNRSLTVHIILTMKSRKLKRELENTMMKIQKDAIDLASKVAEYSPCRDFLLYVQTQPIILFLFLNRSLTDILTMKSRKLLALPIKVAEYFPCRDFLHYVHTNTTIRSLVISEQIKNILRIKF